MASLFLIVSVYNGFFAENVSGNPKEKMYSPAVSPNDPINVTMPPDTVKKTVITKVYVDKDSKDTIVNKEIRIISGKNHADKQMESEDIRITGYGSRQNIHVSSSNHDDDVFIVTEDGNNSTNRVLIKSDTVITQEVMNENSNDDRVITKTIKIRSVDDREKSRILYIINGIPSGHHDPISTIDPVDIETIEVIKDKEIAKYISKDYDPEDYDALIVITTKEHKK
jgi:hypothetical protein